jgi:hypothetical protein
MGNDVTGSQGMSLMDYIYDPLHTNNQVGLL